ncbi:MAG: hypothetical protein KVP17_005176 [Porospora cf. gigantea B]|uniref:uncharacterized protein n=1 Tax=Porospora cf. gigantea B TaxID=2853592 RepID=UPI003571AE78|nr:MAG: hypothetical protein KVP17_005176 [Porospora cf. gigantea B]
MRVGQSLALPPRTGLAAGTVILLRNRLTRLQDEKSIDTEKKEPLLIRNEIVEARPRLAPCQLDLLSGRSPMTLRGYRDFDGVTSGAFYGDELMNVIYADLTDVHELDLFRWLDLGDVIVLAAEEGAERQLYYVMPLSDCGEPDFEEIIWRFENGPAAVPEKITLPVLDGQVLPEKTDWVPEKLLKLEEWVPPDQPLRFNRTFYVVESDGQVLRSIRVCDYDSLVPLDAHDALLKVIRNYGIQVSLKCLIPTQERLAATRTDIKAPVGATRANLSRAAWS